MDELRGVAAGAKAAGIEEVGVLITRAVTFANFPGNFSQFAP
jgi:hypothetical protein